MTDTEKQHPYSDCGGGECTFSVPPPPNNKLGCQPGAGQCHKPQLLEAKPSDFFDQTVADVTAQINEILAGVPEDQEGRKLSFLSTPYGPLLAWVFHGVPSGPDDIPATADPKTLARALGLKGV